MRILVCLVLIFLVVFFTGAYAQEKSGFNEKIVGMAFRTVMRVFVMASDIEQLKKNNIIKVKEMDDEEFAAKRARVYDLAKDLPENIKKEYVISPDIAKAQVIKDIEKLDKNQVYRIIDGLSDKSLARMFKRARGSKAEKSHEADVNSFWEHLTERISNP
jgi:hypothetical protein